MKQAQLRTGGSPLVGKPRRFKNRLAFDASESVELRKLLCPVEQGASVFLCLDVAFADRLDCTGRAEFN